MDRVTVELADRYISTTSRAVAAVEPLDRHGRECLDMASRYLEDAKHYRKKGNLVTAFAACNYAHGWIDAGVRLGALSAPDGSEGYIMPK